MMGAASVERVCALPGCGASLEGRRSDACYCCGAHRIKASKERRQQEAASAANRAQEANLPVHGTQGAQSRTVGVPAPHLELVEASPEPYVLKCALAELLDVSERTIERWHAKGLPHVRTGPGVSGVRYRPSEVVAWAVAQGHACDGSRLRKVSCDRCGYIARTTRKWLAERGAPICPCSSVPMRCASLLDEALVRSARSAA